MPYQTRRISVNLESLGIQLPQTRAPQRARVSKSPSSTTPASARRASASPDQRPAKRIKRAHTLDTSIAHVAPIAPVAPDSARAQPTPPPSPKHQHVVDKQDVNDDIVVAVLEQLEATGNRPHLTKELAAILYNNLPSVTSSQNPMAIVSSRLTNYLRRPWTALAPCPLTKEQVAVHPRRVYYYLTTCKRQDFPEYVDTPIGSRHVISPSISSGPEEFRDLSPSPEIEIELVAADDLAPASFQLEEFDDPPEPTPEVYHEILERDEREFSHTAGVLRKRKETLDELQTVEELEVVSEEEQDQRDQEAATALFGHAAIQHVASSPLVKPQTPKRPHVHFLPLQIQQHPGTVEDWSELKSPEKLDMDELDDLLGGH